MSSYRCMLALLLWSYEQEVPHYPFCPGMARTFREPFISGSQGRQSCLATRSRQDLLISSASIFISSLSPLWLPLSPHFIMPRFRPKKTHNAGKDSRNSSLTSENSSRASSLARQEKRRRFSDKPSAQPSWSVGALRYLACARPSRDQTLLNQQTESPYRCSVDAPSRHPLLTSPDSRSDTESDESSNAPPSYLFPSTQEPEADANSLLSPENTTRYPLRSFKGFATLKTKKGSYLNNKGAIPSGEDLWEMFKVCK